MRKRFKTYWHLRISTTPADRQAHKLLRRAENRTATRHASRNKAASPSGSVMATNTIAVPTVDTHRAHIVRKLQLETRAELLMFALANGVIGPNAD